MTGKIIISIIFSCVIVSTANAMTVSDPTSYAYYVQQLEKAEMQIAEQKAQFAKKMAEYKKHYDEFVKQNEHLVDMYDTMKGTYHKGKSFYNKMMRIYTKLQALPSTGKSYYDKWSRVMTDIEDFQGMAKLADQVMKDGRGLPDYPWDKIDHEYQIRQEAFRGVISSASDIQDNLDKMMASNEALAEEIDNTSNMKEAQDLNNALLLQLIQTQQQELQLKAKIAEAQGLVNYSGVNDEVFEKRLKDANEAKMKNQVAVDEYLDLLRSQGIDPHTSDTDSLKKVFDFGD